MKVLTRLPDATVASLPDGEAAKLADTMLSAGALAGAVITIAGDVGTKVETAMEEGFVPVEGGSAAAMVNRMGQQVLRQVFAPLAWLEQEAVRSDAKLRGRCVNTEASWLPENDEDALKPIMDAALAIPVDPPQPTFIYTWGQVRRIAYRAKDGRPTCLPEALRTGGRRWRNCRCPNAWRLNQEIGR